VGPSQVRANPRRMQAAGRPRARLCLLKGCGKRFKPARPQARYCGESCQDEAARWRAWKAQEHYRHTEGDSSMSLRAEPAPTRAPGGTEAEVRNSPPGRPNRRVGHRPARNLRAAATGRDATRHSNGHAARRHSVFARGLASVPSSESWNASGGGEGAGRRAGEAGHDRVVCERRVLLLQIAIA